MTFSKKEAKINPKKSIKRYFIRRAFTLILVFIGITIMCFGITLLFPDVIEIQTAGNPNISSIKKQELKVEIGLSYEEYRQTSNGQAYWGTCKNVSGVPAIVTNSWNPMTITESQNVQGTVSNSSWEYKSVGEEHSTSSEGEYIFILFKFNLHELGDLRSNIAELKVDITAQAGGNNVLDGWQVYFSYSNNTYDWGWMQQPTEELSSQNATHQFAQPIQKESLESFLVPTAGGFDLFYFLIVSKGTQNNDDAVTIRVDSVFVQARIFKPSPPLFRYCSWILQFFIGQDISYITNEPVREAIWIYGGETFRILLGSLILSLAIGIPTGVIAIIYESPLLNKVIRVTTVLGLSLPLVWLAAVPWYALIPSSPGPGGSYPTPLGILIKSILSIIIPGILGASITADLARSLMLELKNQGKPNSKSLLKELFISKKALEQSIVLIILFLFSSVGMYLLEWIFAIEIMFNIPGIFRIFIYAVITGDIYLGLGIFVVCSIVVLSTIFVIDISYTYLDPQITRIFYRAIYLNPRIRYIPLFRICLLKLGQKKCISSANLWQRFRHHKLGMIGLAMLLIVGFFALTADFLSPYAWKYPEMSEDDGPTPIRGYNVYSLTSAADTNIFDYADPPFNLERTGQIAPDSVHFAVESDAVVPEDSAHTRFIYGICPFNVLPILEGVDFNVSLHLDEVQCVGLNERRFMVQVEVNRNVIGNWTLEDRDKIEFSDQLQVGGRNDIRLIFADISKFPVKLVINWSPITWIENSTPRQMKVNGTILTRGSKTGWKYLATNVRLLDNIFQMRYGLPPFSWNEAVTRYHILGTDKLGHDIVSGLLYGARVVFFVAILATIVSTLIGMFLGSIAGYFSGLVDDVLIRFSEFFIGLPRFILILFVFSFRNFLFSNLWESLIVIAFIIGSTSWSSVFRVVRGAFLSFNERKITSNLCTSRFHFWFLLKHLFLNELSVVIIINLAEVVLFGSALTFLGLGHTSAPDWGRMLELSVEGARFAWWAVLYPGFSLFFLVLTFHFIGESLRDILMNQQGEELEAALNI